MDVSVCPRPSKFSLKQHGPSQCIAWGAHGAGSCDRVGGGYTCVCYLSLLRFFITFGEINLSTSIIPSQFTFSRILLIKSRRILQRKMLSPEYFLAKYVCDHKFLPRDEKVVVNHEDSSPHLSSYSALSHLVHMLSLTLSASSPVYELDMSGVASHINFFVF